MKFKAFPKGDFPGQAVIFDNVPFHHLRMRIVLVIDAIKRVVDQPGMLARLRGWRHHGIENYDIRFRHELDDAVGLRLHNGRLGDGRSSSDRCRAGKEFSAIHSNLLPVSKAIFGLPLSGHLGLNVSLVL